MFSAKRSELRTALTKGQLCHSIRDKGDHHPDLRCLGKLLTKHMHDQYRLQIAGFGVNHPNTIVAKSEYAYHLVNYEDDVTGEILLTELLELTKSVLGPTHF